MSQKKTLNDGTKCPFTGEVCSSECHLFTAHGEDCVLFGILNALRDIREALKGQR
jgi:hypothetical protein